MPTRHGHRRAHHTGQQERVHNRQMPSTCPALSRPRDSGLELTRIQGTQHILRVRPNLQGRGNPVDKAPLSTRGSFRRLHQIWDTRDIPIRPRGAHQAIRALRQDIATPETHCRTLQGRPTAPEDQGGQDRARRQRILRRLLRDRLPWVLTEPRFPLQATEGQQASRLRLQELSLPHNTGLARLSSLQEHPSTIWTACIACPRTGHSQLRAPCRSLTNKWTPSEPLKKGSSSLFWGPLKTTPDSTVASTI